MRHYYEFSFLDPALVKKQGEDGDITECVRYFKTEGEHEGAVKSANKLADKYGVTAQLQKYLVTGERFRNDPLADVDASGPLEEYEGTPSFVAEQAKVGA